MSLLQRLQVVARAFEAASVPLDEALAEFVCDYIGSVLLETDLVGQSRAGARVYSLSPEAAEAAADVLSSACDVSMEKLLSGGLLRDIVHGLAVLHLKAVTPTSLPAPAAGPAPARTNGKGGSDARVSGRSSSDTSSSTSSAKPGITAPPFKGKAKPPQQQQQPQPSMRVAPAPAPALAPASSASSLAASFSSMFSSAAAAAAREDDAIDRELAKLTAKATIRSKQEEQQRRRGLPREENDDYYKSEEFKKLQKQLEEQYTYTTDRPDTFHRPRVTYHEVPKTRYFENKVVSTKGERYIYVQDPKQAEMQARLDALAPKKGPLKIVHTKRAGGKGHKYL